MSREWKPGDVAYWKGYNGKPMVLFRHFDLDSREDEWMSPTEGGAYPKDADLHPLVVIDPEDAPNDPRRFLEHLSRNWAGQAPDDFRLYGGTRLLDWLASQFEPPKPPKPEEPTGLGAVVEDEQGRKFVRVAERFDGWMKDRDWQRIGGELNAERNFGWSAIDAVRVLSEGVTP